MCIALSAALTMPGRGAGRNRKWIFSTEETRWRAIGRITAYPEVESVPHCCVCNFRI